jgi:carbamoyl-phosphate synthase large subunit
VKAPVFSFQKLGSVDPALGPEMKSTGEVLGIDQTYAGALYKALLASGVSVPTHGRVVLTVADEDKPMAVEIARALVAQGYRLAATGGTHAALQAAGIASERLAKIQEGAPSLLDALFVGDVSLMINTPSPGRRSGDEARRIRRACIETGVACVTSIDTASALAQALPYFADPLRADCLSLTEYLAHSETPVRA